MNKIYKVIWNKTRGMYMVVSELAKGQSKDGRRAVGQKKVAQTAAALAVFFSIVSMGGTSFAADTTKVDSSTSGTAVEVYTKDGTDSKAAELDTRITNVKEYLEKQTSDTYVSKADAAVQDGAIVKAANTIGDNVTKLDAALASETAARIGADKAQDKVIQAVNDNLVQSVTTINKNVSDGFNALSQADANEAKARTDADAAEKAAREAGDTALNTRITNVKEYLEQQTSDKYVSKADAAVQDGAIVKANKTIGENVTNLDAALASETAARIGADKAQDKVIQTVNDNLVQSVNTINQNMSAGFNALSQADANELAGRVAADTELAKAVNNGLSLDQDNVLQKNTTSVGEDGTVTTSKEAATTLVMNKDGNNQITLSENGIKVGLNSTVQDAKGFYAGGDTAAAAKAALNADGSIKGADGKFTVDTAGNVATKGGSIKTNGGVIQTGGGNINTQGGALRTNGGNINAGSGTITGNKLTDGVASLQNGDLTTTGNINAHDIVATGDISGKAITGTSLNTQGGAINGGAITGTSINGTTGTFGSLETTGNASVAGTLTSHGINNTGNTTTDSLTVKQGATVGGSLAVTGDITGKSLSVTGDITGKQITGTGLDVGAGLIKTTGSVETGTLETTGNATIGGNLTVDKNLTVNGEFNAKTLSSKLDENNYTEIHGGNVTSVNSKVDTTDGKTYTSTATLTEKGKTETASNGINRNVEKMDATESSDVISNDANGQTSTFRQKIDQILQEIKTSDEIYSKIDQTVNKMNSTVRDGANSTSVEQGTQDITHTAKQGTISNTAKDLVNTAAENMTNTVGKDLTTTVGGNETRTVKGTLTETVIGNVTEDYKANLDTKVGGNETHYVAGNQTNTVSGDRTVNVKGTEKENFNAQVTNVKTDQKTSVGGNQTNIVGGDQQNTVSGSKLETVKGSVTEKYGSQATTIDGDQSTHVGGNQENVVTGNQTNTISGNKTETVKGAVNETYGSQTTKVNGDQSTTVTGKQTNSITGDQVNTIGGSQTTTVTGDVTEDYKANLSTTVGGNQTTTVTGDSSLSAKNITNTATEKLSNAAAEIENSASKSITDKVGANVERTMTTKKISESVKDGTKSNSFSKTAEKDINIITDGTNTSTLSQLADSVNTSLKNGTQSLNNKKTVTEDVTKVTDENTGAFSSSSQKADVMTNTVKNGSKSNTVTETASTSGQKLVSGNIIDILKDAENGYVNTTVTSSDGASSTSVKQGTADITSTATTSIKDVVGKSTVTTTDAGTTFENTDHAAAIGEGSITQTTISGNTLETGKVAADYVDVNKDLNVKGSTKLDGTLEVAGKSTFKDDVTMDKDLTVGGNAAVAGDVTASSYKVADKTYINQSGLNANNQKVTNVADGDVAEGSTDAVNGGQLHATNQRVSTVENRMDGVENRVDRVENRVDNLDNRIDKVGANAAAMANLHPMDFDEDSKVSVAAAVGNYRSETAGALGVFYRPTDRVMMNVSTSFGNGENMVGGGVSFKLGKSSKRLEKAEATNAALVKQVTNLQNRLDALLGVLNPNLSKAFPDVPANHWAYEAVSRLAGNDIIQGYEDGKYHGERTMSRYEMAEIIYNALSKGAKAEAKLVEEFRPELQAMAAQRKA
ncbi:ESPR-type extended signal peptide-containing protein [Acidaminococcus fermentans]|uniref:ESPR-type extended signal peptide-containing protein n=1 Tax=Acidaminococcus fermentans TaxID=905 RepID=UPI003D08489C